MSAIRSNIPNAITCLNVASGVVAIIFGSCGNAAIGSLAGWQWACIFIGIAAVADFLDGFAARALKAYSDMGKELDSLCDAVSFGVAPAILLFHALVWAEAQPWLPWVAILIPVAGVLRLAKFNIDTRQTTSFIGLPIPANAIFWIGFTSLIYGGAEGIASWWCALPVMLVMSWLMVSPLKLFSLKFKTWGWKGNARRWILIIAAPLLLAVAGLPGLMWLIILYLLLSLTAPDGK